MSRLRTTAIIGHGKSMVGKGWGPNIDRCHRVIRMWDCQWQDAKDYGTKYDLGLFEIGCGMTKKFLRMNTKQPADGWIASVCGTEKAHLPLNTTIVDQATWNADAMKMGGIGQTGRLQFQRGVVAACWALDNCGSRSRVLLLGFDNVAAQQSISKEEGFPANYVDQPTTFHWDGYEGGKPKHGNHDYQIEKPFLQKLARERNVLLEFATEATRW